MTTISCACMHLHTAIDEARSNGQPIISLVAVAGTTDFGSVDPLHEMSQLARELGVHLHVDAAWGGPMMMCDSGRELLSGIELGDSVTIDGHKQLMTPIGCGILLSREADTLNAIRKQAPYAIRDTSLDQGRFTLEGTRPAMALYLHAAFHLLGKDGYADLLSRSLERAQQMAAVLKESDAFELVHEPTMNLMVYRYLPTNMRGRHLTKEENLAVNAFNTLLQKRQRALGNTFVSRTKRVTKLYPDQSLVLFRAVLLNPLTTLNHIQQVVADQLVIAEALEQELGDRVVDLEVYR